MYICVYVCMYVRTPLAQRVVLHIHYTTLGQMTQLITIISSLTALLSQDVFPVTHTLLTIVESNLAQTSKYLVKTFNKTFDDIFQPMTSSQCKTLLYYTLFFYLNLTACREHII